MTKLASIAGLALTSACSFSPLSGDSGYGVASGDGSSVWTIGTNETAGTVFRLASDGAHEAVSFPGESLVSISASSPTDVWVVGNGLHHYDGHGWTTRDMPMDPVFAIGRGWAVGVHGTIYDPASFAVLAGPNALIDLEPQGPTVPSAWGDSPSDVWASDAGRLFHFTTAWTDVTPWSDELPQQIVGTTANDVWVSGFSGAMYHFDGTRWTTVLSNVNENVISAMFAVASNDVWAVGLSGVAVHYDGNAWAPVALPPLACANNGSESCMSIQLYGVWASSGSDVWITGYVQQDPGGSPVLYHDDGQWHDVSDASP
ncbi:MAG TPA: hypothetical protein VMJ10_18330 [Kofleriaceae bacterium]|nr:hypothetical protein [Kofleriaceae bacterium]